MNKLFDQIRAATTVEELVSLAREASAKMDFIEKRREEVSQEIAKLNNEYNELKRSREFRDPILEIEHRIGELVIKQAMNNEPA